MIRAIEAIAARMTDDLPDHATARSLRGEVNTLRMRAEALDRVNLNRSPLDTPAAHTVKVAKMARILDKEIVATMNRTGQIFAAGYQDVQRRIDEKVNLVPDAFAGEIRAAFRGLNRKEKGELINRLVNENRGPELAAIVRAPSVLTGITDHERDAYAKALTSRNAAAEVDEASKIEEVYNSTTIAARAATTFIKELTDPGNVARIEHEAGLADSAAADFNQPPQ